LDDVRSFARRQPVLFLASAGAIGFLAGRFVRAGREGTQSSSGMRPAISPGYPMADLPLATAGAYEAPVDLAVTTTPVTGATTSPGLVP